MNVRVSKVFVVAAALGFGCSTLAASAQTRTVRPVSDASAGWMVIAPLSEAYGSGNVISLSGQITNLCMKPLPTNSTFVFSFDNAPIASFTITSALGKGGSQNFAVKAKIPKLPPPPKYVTSLDFAIVLPGAESDGKTSPCEPTFVPDSPG